MQQGCVDNLCKWSSHDDESEPIVCSKNFMDGKEEKVSEMSEKKKSLSFCIQNNKRLRGKISILVFFKRTTFLTFKIIYCSKTKYILTLQCLTNYKAILI